MWSIVFGVVAGLFAITLLIKVIRKDFHLKMSDAVAHRFYNNPDYTNPYTAVDETPCWVRIGKKNYLLKPVKYSSFVRLMSVFDEAVKKLEEADSLSLDTVIRTCQDEMLMGLAYIIDGDKADKLHKYIVDNITSNQLTRIFNVVVMQNDISVFLGNIQKLVKKKGIALET